jgi:hypothetical protein
MFNFGSRSATRTNSRAAALMDQFSRLGESQGTAIYHMPGGSVQTVVLHRTATALAENPLPGMAPGTNPEALPSSDKSASGSFDLRPTAAIGKGERLEPFTISWHSQREIVGKLAWQSTASIWGGPLLTLICLWFLKSYFEFVQ